MNDIIEDKNIKLNKKLYDYTDKINIYFKFIVDIASNLLELNNFNHNKNKWYIDVIRYKLNNDTNGIKSGLAWH